MRRWVRPPRHKHRARDDKERGWTWRYDLVQLGPSETEVTLTYDWSAVPPHIREYIHFPPFGPDHLANSLHHLAELAALASRA
jgi:hypothetical protein